MGLNPFVIMKLIQICPHVAPFFLIITVLKNIFIDTIIPFLVKRKLKSKGVSE